MGEYQSFSLYLLYVFFPLGMLGFIIQLMAQAAASSNRIFEILDAKNEVADKPDAVTLPPIQGHVEFKDVTFRYFASGEPVLAECQLRSEARSDDCSARRHGQRQDDDHQPDPALL